MSPASALDESVINGLQSHLALFEYSVRELNALALGLLEGIKLAGGQAPLLELAITTDNVKRLVAGELSD